MAVQKEAFHQASPTEAFLLNCWYVAAWDYEVTDKKPETRQSLDEVRTAWHDLRTLNAWLADNVGATTKEPRPRR